MPESNAVRSIINQSFNPSYDAIDIISQNKQEPPTIQYFNLIENSTTLTVETAIGDRTITVADATGIATGTYLVLFSIVTNRVYFGVVLSVVGLVVTLDTPIDSVYPVGTFVDDTTRELNVNGSITPQIFGLRGTSSAPGIEVVVIITRIIIQMFTSTIPDLSKFGDLTELTNGLVLRKFNDITSNIYNIKTNGDIANIAYDLTVYDASNPGQGLNGVAARLTFGSNGKMGTAIKLAPGEDLQLLIQDDLTGLDRFRIVAEGHIEERE